ncbi:MAG TPA: YraN family protein [Casimicrobiaceae bacterium]|jgi:putative endonuclease|nr:YraN family protein [Casimicrobiaceae bacterium]
MNRGAAAEALAADFLEARGLTIVTRNYRCRGGEIDLIASNGDTLIFVEVRLRSDAAFGGAAESITAAKKKRLRFAAAHYLSGLGRMSPMKPEPPCRFDAILLSSLDPGRIEWLVDIDAN